MNTTCLYDRCFTRTHWLVLIVAAMVTVPQTLWAQQKADPDTPKLVLPQIKKPAGEQLSSEANVMETLPGSLEDVNKRLQALTQRVDALETSLEQRMDRIESALREYEHKTQKPQCSADLQTSIDPVSGAADACKPYACNRVDGLCRTSCRDTSDCATNAVCNNYHCTFAR